MLVAARFKPRRGQAAGCLAGLCDARRGETRHHQVMVSERGTDSAEVVRRIADLGKRCEPVLIATQTSSALGEASEFVSEPRLRCQIIS